MHVPPIVALVAIAFVSTLTAFVLVFVIRARRLNADDLCGLCGRLLPIEARYRFHSRSVCPHCHRRLRRVTIPRLGRVALLLFLWGIGAAASVAMVVNHDHLARVWVPVFSGLVGAALLVGALPAPSEREDRTAATLRWRHAFLTEKQVIEPPASRS